MRIAALTILTDGIWGLQLVVMTSNASKPKTRNYGRKPTSRTGLFRVGKTMHGNVVLNFLGSPKTELNAYGGAFWRAGRLLARSMAAKRGYHDLDGLPIVSLYKHALELQMKAVVRRGQSLVSLDGKTLSIPSKALVNHELRRLLKPIREIFTHMSWTWKTEVEGVKSFEDFEAIVREIDRLGDAWRYPVDKDDKDLVSHHFVFNVLEFAEQLEAAISLLDGASAGLEAAWDELASEAYAIQEAERSSAQISTQ